MTDPTRISDDQHNNAPAVPEGWRDFLTELSKQKPEKPDYWSSCGQCERNSSTAEDLIAATPAPAPAQEPAGEAVAAALGDIIAMWDQHVPSEYVTPLHMQAKRALEGQQPVSPDMHGWCAYVGGMVAHWIRSEPDAFIQIGEERFEAAIAGIIERRLWAMPKDNKPTAAPKPAQEVSDKHEREMLEVIDERDRVHEWADQLADAIAKHTGYEIGEHTSENNPWRMALNALVCHEAKQEVGLTDEELEECFRRAHEEINTAYVPTARFPIGWRLYGRQVIAALRAKEQA